MRAVVVEKPGGPEVLRVAEVPDPAPKPGEVLIRVAAAGVNRADLLQRRGYYPPPPGASDILGLEVAGTVEACGEGVDSLPTGARVMALLEGGGYAELAVAAATQVVPVPEHLDLEHAAAVPEVFITAHDNLFTRGRLQRGEVVLIHGGAGGVGTVAIQLARQRGCTVATTAGSPERVQRCRDLGAQIAINHRTEDFVERIRQATDGRGADVILDVMGASYLERNLEALAPDGRLVVIGMQGGTTAEIDLSRLNRVRGTVTATHLRGRPRAQKAAIVQAFSDEALPLLATGAVRPVLDRALPMDDVRSAHEALEAGEPVGKVVLLVTRPDR